MKSSWKARNWWARGPSDPVEWDKRGSAKTGPLLQLPKFCEMKKGNVPNTLPFSFSNRPETRAVR